MKDINEAVKLESIDEVREEIKQRRKLIYEMVGTLYPSILAGEIAKLQARFNELWIKANKGTTT